MRLKLHSFQLEHAGYCAGRMALQQQGATCRSLTPSSSGGLGVSNAPSRASGKLAPSQFSSFSSSAYPVYTCCSLSYVSEKGSWTARMGGYTALRPGLHTNIISSLS